MVGRSLKTKLVLSFLAVIFILSFLTAMLGFYLIDKDILYKAQGKVQSDLNFAREVYRQQTRVVGDVVRLTAAKLTLREAILTGDNDALTRRLDEIRKAEKLDVLTLTDAQGVVLTRSRNPAVAGDDQKGDPVVAHVLSEQQPTVGTAIVSAAELRKEGTDLAQQAYIRVVPTPKAKPTGEVELTSGMMIKAAAPIFDQDGRLIGVLYGGNLLNRNYAIVDKVKRIVYQDATYKGKDIGTVTIFQKDVRISTNVKNGNGGRAIGTRVSAEVCDRVLGEGRMWCDRAFVVNDWYKTCYEPIRDIDGQIIGMLYIGTLELPFNDLARNTMLVFLAIIGAATAVAVTLSYILAGRVSQPLMHFRDATAKLSAGELGHTIETSFDVHELNELAVSFNAMSQQLEERDARLTLSNERLADLNKRYIDLIGFVAHELRGILASAVLNVYAVRDGLLGLINFKQQKAIDSVARNLDYLTAVVGKFLNLGRIEKGELNIHKSRIDMNADVFGASIGALRLLATRKRITINNYLPPELKVNADPDLMQIVANNLIGNAIKYGTENGCVTVKSHEVNGHVEIEVYNDAVPIPPEQTDKLFVRFSRLDNEQTKRVKGTGLGLYITKQIIEGHGGAIRVEPREKGNAFIFSIDKDLQSDTTGEN
ncbi:MAG: cache domain-containing protein [Anaerohalosphaeraceae bacterium]|jgi:two-component system NtrC family sensor kinase